MILPAHTESTEAVDFAPGSFSLNPFGDSCLSLRFDSGDFENDWRRVHSVTEWLRSQQFDFIVSLFATYDTSLIEFDPEKVQSSAVRAIVDQAIGNYRPEMEEWLAGTRLLDVPVVYGGEYGVDFEDVAREQHLEPEELIEANGNGVFTVRCISPGGGVMLTHTTSIRDVPRLSSPRIGYTPPGRIAFAGNQALISPKQGRYTSGWRLIGCTPSLLVDTESDVDPMRLHVGDRIRFRPIHANEWATYEGSVLNPLEEAS